MRGLSGARVLVTGASGMIGRAVLELLPADVDTHAVSRQDRASRSGGAIWHRLDLGEPGAATGLVHQVMPDVVIHLAGEVRGERAIDAVRPTFAANLVATVEILEAATRLGCHRIVASGSLLEEPIGSAQAVPPSPYGASRWAASAYARMFHALFDTPVVILRPSFAYGPGQELTKLVPHVVMKLLADESPALADGARLIDFVFAPDVARAYLAAAVARNVEGSTIDIGTGQLTAVRDVVETIVELIGPTSGAPAFGELPVRPLEQQVEVDTVVAEQTLGWHAETPLREGLRRTVEWYRDSASDSGGA